MKAIYEVSWTTPDRMKIFHAPDQNEIDSVLEIVKERLIIASERKDWEGMIHIDIRPQ